MKTLKSFTFVLLVFLAAFLITNCHEKPATAPEAPPEATTTPGGTQPPGETVLPDKEAPTFKGIQGVEIISEDTIKVTWLSATDNKSSPEQIQYLIYIVQDESDFRAEQPFTVTANTVFKNISIGAAGLERGKSYLFRVNARDLAGNVDSNDVYKSLEIPEITPPPPPPPPPPPDNTPPNFQSFNASYTISQQGNQVLLSWDKEDGVKYFIFKSENDAPVDYNADPLATVEDSQYADNDVVLNGKYNYGMYAIKTVNDLKAGPVDEKTLELVDGPPSEPEIAAIYATGPYSGEIKWNASTDNYDKPEQIAYTIIWTINNIAAGHAFVQGEAGKTVYTLEIFDLDPDTTYSVSLYAQDSNGQLSSDPDDASKGHLTTAKLTKSLYVGNNDNGGNTRVVYHVNPDTGDFFQDALYFPEAGSGVPSVAVGALESKLFVVNNLRKFYGIPLPIPVSPQFIYNVQMNETNCSSGQIVKNFTDPNAYVVYALCNKTLIKSSYTQSSINPFMPVFSTTDTSKKYLALHSSGKKLYLASASNVLHQINTADNQAKTYQLGFTPTSIFTTSHYRNLIFLTSTNNRIYSIAVDSLTGTILEDNQGQPAHVNTLLIPSAPPAWPSSILAAVSPLKIVAGVPVLIIAGENKLFAYTLNKESVRPLPIATSPDVNLITSIKPDFSGNNWFIGYKKSSGQACILKVIYDRAAKHFQDPPNTITCNTNANVFSSIDIASQ